MSSGNSPASLEMGCQLTSDDLSRGFQFCLGMTALAHIRTGLYVPATQSRLTKATRDGDPQVGKTCRIERPIFDRSAHVLP